MSVPAATLQSLLDNGAADAGLIRLYGEDALLFQKSRYQDLLNNALTHLGSGHALLASAPGRTELGGNHTDHNNGRVLASAVDLDCIGVCTATTDSMVTVHSADHPETIRVNIEQLSPDQDETATPQALIRGIAAARNQTKRMIGGFTAVIHSTVKPGTGLSSSAAFSILLGAFFSALFDRETADPVQLARDGRFAENHFFGKPCGLMDQLASAVGSTLGIDFEDPENPLITTVNCEVERFGYRLLIVDTGGSHADLSPDYAAVTEEISRAVEVLGVDIARGVTTELVLEHITEIRHRAGDRAVLRLLHFISEDRRAAEQLAALTRSDFDTFLKLAEDSGDSSCLFLQNCSSPKNSREQGLLLAMALTRTLFPEAICRVHGGGFAGTVQTYIPHGQFNDYRLLIETVFGEGAVLPVLIGRPGVCVFTEKGWHIYGERR